MYSFYDEIEENKNERTKNIQIKKSFNMLNEHNTTNNKTTSGAHFTLFEHAFDIESQFSHFQSIPTKKRKKNKIDNLCSIRFRLHLPSISYTLNRNFILSSGDWPAN